MSSTLKTSAWAGAAALVVGASLFTLPGTGPVDAIAGFTYGQRCYPARRTKGVVIPPIVATIQDLAQTTNSTIGKPFQLCFPAAITDDVPSNSTTFLPFVTICYKVKDAKGTPKFPASGQTASIGSDVPAIGNETVTLKSSSVICVPFQEIL